MQQFANVDNCIAARALEIRTWAQDTYERLFGLDPDSDSDSLADANLPEGLTAMQLVSSSAKNIKIELRGDEARSSLRMEGMERTKSSGPFWDKRLDLHFVPSEIVLSLPANSKDGEVGITKRVVTVRFEVGDMLTHLSIQHYHESPALVAQEVLERKDQPGWSGMAFYRSHVASIPVKYSQDAFIGGHIDLKADANYSLKQWPSLAKLQTSISPTWTLQSGEKPEFGLRTKRTSDRPIASAAQLFQVGLDSSAEAWRKIEELCDACPEVIDFEDWISLAVSLITTTGLSIEMLPTQQPRASLVRETAQELLG